MFLTVLVGMYRDFSLFTQHPVLCIFFEVCTQTYCLSEHGLMWKYSDNCKKLLGNQQKLLIFISFPIFTMTPTNSKALEVTEKLPLIFRGQWIRPYLALVTFLKGCVVNLTHIHHITMLAYGATAKEYLGRKNLKQ